MCFEQMQESAERGELMLVEGGMCHYHLRRSGQVTIRELLVLPERQREGIGRRLVSDLMWLEGAISVLAKCPADLPSNGFYAALGFEHEATEQAKSGRNINVWRKSLS